MQADARQFIENATLMFIASRNAEGALDVSPRGGQPSVVQVDPEGRLLLPDIMGNRRLDTIGNILARPEVGLAMFNRGADRFLRVQARAEVSFLARHIAAFPADETPPKSVLVLTVTETEFVTSSAFARADFWLDPSRRKPPLDLLGILSEDFRLLGQAGQRPVMKHAAEEALLAAAGVRDVYGASSQLVATKVYDRVEVGTRSFIEEAGFVVLAREDATGRIVIDLTGEAPLAIDPLRNSQGFRLSVPPELSETGRTGGELALLASVPGRAEALRVNGTYTDSGNGVRDLQITPREVFFHCSAALSRSRIWIDDRRIPWNGRRRFTCVSRRAENPEVMSFVLRSADQAPLGMIAPGQYVTVSLPDDPVEPARRRSYSVSARPDDQSLQIAVRRIGKGGLSDLLHEALVPGHEVLLGVPAGHFVLDSPDNRPVVLVSAGVGITPVLPMLRERAATPGAPVWFVHAARDARHHLFPAEVREIAATAQRPVHLVSAYSRPGPQEACDLAGRLDAAALARLTPVAGADYYICGPEDFMSGLRAGLIALGADPAHVRQEEFTAPGGALAGLATRAGDLKSCSVTFGRSGRVATWTPTSGSLLDLALGNRIDVAYSCRLGDCQSCVQRLVSGPVEHLTEEPPVLSEDQVLLCQAIPLGDLVIDC